MQGIYKIEEDKEQVIVEVPSTILIILNTFFILIIFALIATSPNNITTARRVYQAPLLKLSECQMIIDMAKRAAERNAKIAQAGLALPIVSSDEIDDEEKRIEYTKLLQWPQGWKKDRHTSYPTTDLNVVVDFEKEDLDVLSKLLNARLSPLLERIYGISKDSIRANDMFVVRYDGAGQQALNPHTDYSHISFNILLNDEFVGGGTRFYNRLNQETFDARPKPGDVLINNAMVTHEGLATTKGMYVVFFVFFALIMN